MLILKVFDFSAEFDRPGEFALLRAKLTDPMVRKFVNIQINEAAKQLNQLDPSNIPNDKALEYLHFAKEARQVWLFWTDFAGFLDDLTSSTRS